MVKRNIQHQTTCTVNGGALQSDAVYWIRQNSDKFGQRTPVTAPDWLKKWSTAVMHQEKRGQLTYKLRVYLSTKDTE